MIGPGSLVDHAVDALGYAAAALVFSTFYVRTMVPLRVIGIASNVAFLSYGLALGLWPVAALHGVLLPLNAVRLVQLRRTLAAVDGAPRSALDPSGLLSRRPRERHPPGHTLFRKGTRADCAFYIVRGAVELPELGVRLAAGELFGAVGLLSTERVRTGSAVTVTATELVRLDERAIALAVHRSPAFGLALARLVADRVTTNLAVADARLGALLPSLAPRAPDDEPSARARFPAAGDVVNPVLQ